MIERRAVTVAVEGVPTLVNGWQCVCDACGDEAPGCRDAGDASDLAQSAGFRIVREDSPSRPSKWLCAPCVERRTAPRKMTGIGRAKATLVGIPGSGAMVWAAMQAIDQRIADAQADCRAAGLPTGPLYPR